MSKQEAERIRLLTARMASGEEAAFSEFHGLYSDRLFRFLLVVTRGSEDLARELCQTTMVKVVRSVREFEDEEHLWNWLTKIGRNCFIDALRKRKTAPQTVSLTEVDFQGGSENEIDFQGELEDALKKSLDDLEEGDRRLIDEFYFEERSQKAIAEEHQTSSKAIESKLARIRQKLRTTLMTRLRYEK